MGKKDCVCRSEYNMHAYIIIINLYLSREIESLLLHTLRWYYGQVKLWESSWWTHKIHALTPLYTHIITTSIIITDDDNAFHTVMKDTYDINMEKILACSCEWKWKLCEKMYAHKISTVNLIFFVCFHKKLWQWWCGDYCWTWRFLVLFFWSVHHLC